MTTIEIILSVALIINSIAVYHLLTTFFKMRAYIEILIRNNNSAFDIFVDITKNMKDMTQKISDCESRITMENR